MESNATMKPHKGFEILETKTSKRGQIVTLQKSASRFAVIVYWFGKKRGTSPRKTWNEALLAAAGHVHEAWILKQWAEA